MSVNENKTNKTDNVKLHRPPHFDPAVKLHNLDMAIVDDFLKNHLPLDVEPTVPAQHIFLNSLAYLNAMEEGYKCYRGKCLKELPDGDTDYPVLIRTLKYKDVNAIEGSTIVVFYQILLYLYEDKIFVRNIYRKNEGTRVIGNWNCIIKNLSDIAARAYEADHATNATNALQLGNRVSIGYVKTGSASGLLSHNVPPTVGSYYGAIYSGIDTNNVIGGGAGHKYGIFQINVEEGNNNSLVRLAVDMSNGSVYSYGNGSWHSLTPTIPIVTADPVSPVEGEMWIRSDLD